MLVDDSETVWDFLSGQKSETKIVDLILDNAGFELFADLCLAGYFFIAILFHPILLNIEHYGFFHTFALNSVFTIYLYRKFGNFLDFISIFSPLRFFCYLRLGNESSFARQKRSLVRLGRDGSRHRLDPVQDDGRSRKPGLGRRQV